MKTAEQVLAELIDDWERKAQQWVEATHKFAMDGKYDAAERSSARAETIRACAGQLRGLVLLVKQPTSEAPS